MMMSRRGLGLVVRAGLSQTEREKGGGEVSFVGARQAGKAKQSKTRRASDRWIHPYYLHTPCFLFVFHLDPSPCTRPFIHTSSDISLIAQQSTQSNPIRRPPVHQAPHFVMDYGSSVIGPMYMRLSLPLFAVDQSQCVLASLGRETRSLHPLTAHPSVMGPVCSFGRRVSQKLVSLAGGTSGKSKTLCCCVWESSIVGDLRNHIPSCFRAGGSDVRRRSKAQHIAFSLFFFSETDPPPPNPKHHGPQVHKRRRRPRLPSAPGVLLHCIFPFFSIRPFLGGRRPFDGRLPCLQPPE